MYVSFNTTIYHLSHKDLSNYSEYVLINNVTQGNVLIVFCQKFCNIDWNYDKCP